MTQYKTIISTVAGALVFPLVSQAQVWDFPDFVDLLLYRILNPLVGVFIALALIYFIWGLANFILHADDEQARSKGKQIMVWGVIALFVMISIWGIVLILKNTFLSGVGTGRIIII